MSLNQINGIRERSKSKDRGPWISDWSEMARKTVIRRLAKRLPVDSDIARVVERIDEDYDFGPNGRTEGAVADEDGVTHTEARPAEAKAPAKARGAAAAKLNPKQATEAAAPSAPAPEGNPASSSDADFEEVELGVDADHDGADDLGSEDNFEDPI